MFPLNKKLNPDWKPWYETMASIVLLGFPLTPPNLKDFCSFHEVWVVVEYLDGQARDRIGPSAPSTRLLLEAWCGLLKKNCCSGKAPSRLRDGSLNRRKPV